MDLSYILAYSGTELKGGLNGGRTKLSVLFSWERECVELSEGTEAHDRVKILIY